MFKKELLCMEKKMIVLVGPPGVGKSTFVKQKGWRFATISADAIRESLGCAVINEDGSGYIDQSKNKQVFAIFNRVLEDRLKDGVTTVIDNTNLDNWVLKELKQKADTYGFSFEVIVFDIPIATSLERNTQRGYKNVPEDVVRRMYDKFHTLDLSKYYIRQTITEADQK